jgi:tetratricopeptide (TPR) repeat protein
MKTALPASIILIGLVSLYPLQRWIDRTWPREAISDETLYFSNGETIKRMSLGLESLAADIYWIRTVQYFGRKLLESDSPVSVASTRNLRMDLLAPLLNIVVTLDPHHIPAYRFGAIFLPDHDLNAAIALLERGIRENPEKWRLYQDLGYIYWQMGDFNKAAEVIERGAGMEGAPWWMRDLAGVMRIRGGSREVARRIYLDYANDEDQNIRAQAIERLKQLRSLDEIDLINARLARYREQTGHCPESLRELSQLLRQAGLTLNEELLPVDPNGFAYVLDQAKCQAQLSPNSTILR